MSDSGSGRTRLRDRDIKKIGRAGGNNVNTRELKNQLQTLNRNVSNVSDKVGDVETRVEKLENRIVEVEQQKAEAKQSAREDLLDDLRETYEEKQRQYRRKRQQIIEDYKEGIGRLKDRFISSISDQSEHFDQVDDEFDAVEQKRETAAESGRATTGPMTRNYQQRLDLIRQSRDDFIENVDRFLEHRRDTAQTIESLQTGVPGLDDAARIDVPFWVVVAESDGRERVAVLPVMERGRPSEQPSAHDPYVSYLQPNDRHDYRNLTAAVEEYVERDGVRQRLESRQGDYADPSFMRRNGYVGDRFVDALETYQFGGQSGGRSQSQSTSEPGRTEQARTEAVTDD